MKEHHNAEIFRAIADGKRDQVWYTAPWLKEPEPLKCCSSSVLTELHNPGSLIPSGIKFFVKEED